jgi:uridine kinase
MIGDKMVITDYHRTAAAKALEAIERRLAAEPGVLAVSIAGESGCGKTETAHCLGEAIEKTGRSCIVLSQDDYFRLPPKSNHNKRIEDIAWVGTGEVRLDLLGEHALALKAGIDKPLEKPLVYFEEDRIGSETVAAGNRDVVIVEGTFTTLLPDIDVRVFGAATLTWVSWSASCKSSTKRYPNTRPTPMW